jgi:hypothetical protein
MKNFKVNRRQEDRRRTFSVRRVFRGHLENPMDDVEALTASVAATNAAKDDGEEIEYVTPDAPTPGAATAVCKGDVEYIAEPKDGPPQKISFGTF